MLDHIGQGVCYFDRDRRLILSNRRYAQMYGLDPDSIRPGMSLEEIAAGRFAGGAFPRVTQQEYLAWCDKVNVGSEPRTWTTQLTDGRTIRVYHQPMPDGGWVATHEDVTQSVRAEGELRATQASLLEEHEARAESEEKLAHLASHDALTGLPNRPALAKRLASAFDRAATSGEQFAVLCFDLDYFQGVNEFFGQSIGDSLLRAVVARFRAVTGGAFLARTGGDEFILLSEGKQPSAAESIAEQLLEALAEDFVIAGQRMRVGLSVGVAVYPADGADEITLLGAADAALHRAKAEGRGTFRLFETEMDVRQRECATLQSELRSVVKEGELVLHYQPMAQIGGEIFGFEALVRWRHPTRGLLLPGEFIALAEESNLICELGEWVLREACREAMSWKRPLQVAVNISPLQLRDPISLPDLVRAVLSETGLAAERLSLEITERVVIADPPRVLSILRELKTLGLKIAMDDFGTGYSSLSALRSFPFDKIKIDREFVSTLVGDEHSTAVVRALIGLGHNLRIPVVAEGVETEEQLLFLMKEGCEEIQGYLIGHPLTMDEYAEIVG
ncbi:MAG: putative bifunctional diguanylate cyclase/phosphodiesterase [Roseiarcus sp.]